MSEFTEENIILPSGTTMQFVDEKAWNDFIASGQRFEYQDDLLAANPGKTMQQIKEEYVDPVTGVDWYAPGGGFEQTYDGDPATRALYDFITGDNYDERMLSDPTVNWQPIEVLSGMTYDQAPKKEVHYGEGPNNDRNPDGTYNIFDGDTGAIVATVPYAGYDIVNDPDGVLPPNFQPTPGGGGKLVNGSGNLGGGVTGGGAGEIGGGLPDANSLNDILYGRAHWGQARASDYLPMARAQGMATYGSDGQGEYDFGVQKTYGINPLFNYTKGNLYSLLTNSTNTPTTDTPTTTTDKGETVVDGEFL